MTRVWATARVLAALAVSFIAAKTVFEWLGEHAVRSGYTPDEKARMAADERRRRGLGEPDHADWLPEFEGGLAEPTARPALGTWTHPHGQVTVIRPSGSACGSCGMEEPA